MFWCIWGVTLLVQNFSFTAVSRARNSGSYLYHGIAAIGSNGVWFASQIFVIGLIAKALLNRDPLGLFFVGAFYTVMTTIGSLLAHYILAKYVETGKRKVGAS